MDVSPNPQRVEFTAVILSGFGNELLPLTADHGGEPVPKSLLPIANQPLLNYTLSWIDQSGIQDVLIVCPSSHHEAISRHIRSGFPVSSIRVDVFPYDHPHDRSIGTCGLLRQCSSHVQTDFVLLPVDFIPPPSLPLSALLNKFRADTVSDGAISTACWFESRLPIKGIAVGDWGSVYRPTPIVWEEKTGSLLYIDSPDDVDRNSEDIDLRMGLLTQHSQAKISASLQDSHVYVCKRSVLDALHAKPHLDSWREDFFPWLCKVQSQRSKREKYCRALSPATDALPLFLALQHSTLCTSQTRISGKCFFTPPKEHALDHETSGPISPAESGNQEDAPASLRISLIVHRARDGFAVRVNNLHAYLEANTHFLNSLTYIAPVDPLARSLIDQKALISSDSLIGDSSRVEERASIKRSVIGRHCFLGKMVKLVGCVLMDHCVIAEGAKLEGCLLGMNTKVGPKAELVRCVTQAGYEIESGGTYKNEKFEISDWAAGGAASESGSELG